MSVLWMDDPSFYGTAQITSRYNSGAIGVESGMGRFGGSAWGATNNSSSVATKTVATAVTGTQGIAFKWSGSSITSIIMSFLDSSSTQVDLRVNGAGQFIVTRNGTQIGSTSTNALSSGIWYRVEFKVTIDPSAGVIEVRVFGSSTGWIPSTSGLNTRATANTSFNQIQIGGASNSATHNYFNDWVYTDTNSPNANFLGDKRCFLLSPNANSSVQWTPTFASWAASTVMVVGQQIKDSNGNVQQVQSVTSDAKTGGSAPTWATTGGNTTTDNHVTWVVVGSGANPGATNWMAVSEIPEDGDNSYNTDSTPGDVDLFSHPNLPAGAQNISAVDNVVFARKDDAGTRSIASQIKSSTTTSTGATVALSTSYTFIDQIAETDPNTSAAWTASGVNSALFGYKEIA